MVDQCYVNYYGAASDELYNGAGMLSLLSTSCERVVFVKTG